MWEEMSQIKRTDKITPFLLLLLSMFMLSASVCAAPGYKFCNSPSNYTPNSPFDNNLRQLLKSLSTHTLFRKGFYNTSFGNGNDQVYGQALCRGDVTPKVCQDCIRNAIEEIKTCSTEEGIIWQELCQIQYSYRYFFSSMTYGGKFPESNEQEKEVSDPVQFLIALKDLILKISSEAAFDPTKLMFFTGAANYSRNETIYGLVQCTRDISPSDCKRCLDDAFGDLKACCSSRQGGTIFSSTCNMRFEAFPFYNKPTYKVGGRKKIRIEVLVSCITLIFLTTIAVFFILYCLRSRGSRRDEERSVNAMLHEIDTTISVSINQEVELVSSQELPFLGFGLIKAATNSFDDVNKLGQGGFGIVYKGVLPDGKEIAVKRLLRMSWRGLEQFKNEVILIARLQHNNLVRLKGCATEGDERLLVYEYMPNKSLNLFIFDSQKRAELHWDMRLNIILGIARGLLYLHEDSRHRIIHRDLKPSNVLLDHEMVAKISDFGMARIFGENQNTGKTRKVVGTYGYMAPEYAMEGLFSVKSDVFSFGVVMLEIISGKRSNSFYLTEHAPTLLAYAWRLWNEGNELEFIDPLLTRSCPIDEVIRCIHIGLLCVQEDPTDRPTMSTVVVLLGSELITLPEPKAPAYSVSRVTPAIDLSSGVEDPSVSMVTVSIILGR